MNIPLARPWFDESDEAALLETLRSGWVGAGPKVSAFEQAFSEYVGAPYAATASSCTAALHIAVTATGIGPGDEVLVPSFTWLSTPNAVEYAGARPVFCDIDPVSFNIDLKDASRRITNRTRCIIAVHLFGLSADMQGAKQLASQHNLLVIEDAACALGSYYEDKHVGTLGDVGCFSFHPRKSITTGEGGMLITSRQELDAVFRSLRDIGSDRANLSAERAAKQLMPDHPILGFNYRMTDLQAALGIAQLAKFDAILRRRLECARRYDDLIRNSSLKEWLSPPLSPRGREHSYQAYVCRLTPPDHTEETLYTWHERRNHLMGSLFESGIGTRPGTHASHLLGYYHQKYGIAMADYPQSWHADWLTIALPLYPQMTASDQESVCEALQRFWQWS